jgi:hypothetical protein
VHVQPIKPFTPPSNTKAVTGPAGHTVYSHQDGRKWEVGDKGQLAHFSKPGVDARFRDDGRVSHAQFVRPDHSTLIVNRSIHGTREVIVERPDHSRLVSMGPHQGFVERPLPERRGYISRTYVVENRTYVNVYRTYTYHNIVYQRYVPSVYYRPAFYGWTVNPWARPVVFAWGWRTAPWYGYYGAYFVPAPVYPTAALWLADFLLAENLKAAYQSQQAANAAAAAANQPPPPPPAGVALTPEVKQAIAEEVRRQLAAEQAAAAQPATAAPVSAAAPEAVPPALDPNQRLYVVSMNLDAVAAGQTCALTPGDVVIRTSETLVNGTKVPVSVLSSKPGDCPSNSSAALEVADLQEMNNQFQAQLGTGLKQLADNNGAGGLPAAPAADPRSVAEGTAPADAAVESELTKQQQDAAQAETELQQAAAIGS